MSWGAMGRSGGDRRDHEPGEIADGTADEAAALVAFGERFAASPSFDALFTEATQLVEATAAYLDGAGRRDAARLAEEDGLVYANESMRLTTRLMRLMSWLILRRAVTDGEMTREEADRERAKGAAQFDEGPTLDALGRLPRGLVLLIGRAARLQGRLLHLEASASHDRRRSAQSSPALRALGHLEAAFGAERRQSRGSA